MLTKIVGNGFLDFMPIFAVSNSKIWEERNRKSFWKT